MNVVPTAGVLCTSTVPPIESEKAGDDVEPEPDASVGARRGLVDLVEALEDPRDVSGVDPDPFIPHPERQRRLVDARSDRDRCRRRRVLQRVVHQVDEHVLHPAPVDRDRWELVGELADDALARLVEVGDHLVDQVLEGEHEHRVVCVVVLEVGLAEHVADQAEQPTRLPLDRRERFDRDRIARQRRLAQDVDVAADARERCAELVGRRGDEVALHPVELAELGDGVLLALQQVGELICLLLQPVVLSPERSGDPDHQGEKDRVEHEQTDAERDRKRSRQAIDLGLDDRVVLVDLDHAADRAAHPDAERHVRLEQSTSQGPLADVLVGGEIRDLARELTIERFLEVVLQLGAGPDLVAVVREEHRPVRAPELDPKDPRIGQDDRSHPLIDLLVPVAGDRGAKIGLREDRPERLVRHELRPTCRRPFLPCANVPGAERGDRHPDQDEHDQAGEGEPRHDPYVWRSVGVDARHL